MSGGKIRRVPPPPPPGFGDEEFYRLYGRPEDYHRYRQRLEESYQDFRCEKYSPNYSHHRSPLCPPSPPPLQQRRYSESPDVRDSSQRGFENFRVTIENMHEEKAKLKGFSSEYEGTPSLSGVEEEESSDEDSEEGSIDDESDEEGSEEESSPPTSRQPVRPNRGHKEEEDVCEATPPPRPVKTKGSVKDRLGNPPKDFAAENLIRRDSISKDSRSRDSRSKNSRYSNSRSRNSKSRDTRSRNSSSRYSRSKNSRCSNSRSRNSRSKHSSYSNSRSRNTPRNSGSRNSISADLKFVNSKTKKLTSKWRKSRRSKFERQKSRRSMTVTPEPFLPRRVQSKPKRFKSRRSITITPEPLPPRKQCRESLSPKRSRRKSTDPLRPRRTKKRSRTPLPSDRSRSKDKIMKRSKVEMASSRRLRMDGESGKKRSKMRAKRFSRERLDEENEKMMKTLKRQRSGKPRTSELDKNLSLARLAGLEITDLIPKLRSDNRNGKRSRDRPRGTTPPLSSNESKSSRRSSRERNKKQKKSSKKWQHDKFLETSPANYDKEHGKAFGSHWERFRSDQDRDRGRRRSPSTSKRRKRTRSSRYLSPSSGSGRKRSSSSSSSSVDRERKRFKKCRRNEEITRAATLASKALARQQVSKIQQENDSVNMKPSGKLAEDTNMVNGVLVKYSEPPEAKRPRTKWRLYVFKGNEELPILYIHRQSSYLLGRDRKVADIPLDHPSCSKQHAALQYRLVEYGREDGSKGRRVIPYVIDLNSANGTFVNNSKIENQKFVQLKEKDVLKFGFSSREYVMLHDQSKELEEDDPGMEN